MTYYTIYMLDGTRLVTTDVYFPNRDESQWSQIHTVDGEKIIVNMARVSYVKASDSYEQPKSQMTEVVEATLRGIGLISDKPKLDIGEHIDDDEM